MDDTTIIDLYFARDEAAIRHTAEKYGGRLRALSHGIVQDMQTAEECENDTYLQAWNAIPPHDPKEYLYDAYYVPAIADAYLENMPVYDGRFN